MDELLAILGGSWRQLLLYSGGLTLIGVVLVTYRLWRRTGLELPRQPLDYPVLLIQIMGLALYSAALPWPKTYWAYPLDLWTALLLLEAPYWLELRRAWGSVRPTVRLAAAQQLATVLRVYPLLALATALLAQNAGSLIIRTIQQGHGLLHWSGLLLWAITLPPLLLLGPWCSVTNSPLPQHLRRVGHIALLTVLALPGGDAVPYSAGTVAALTSFGSLVLLDHLWQRHARTWEWFQPGLTLMGLLLLLWTAAQDFAARLH
ncbi:MAG: hypothetical protein H0X37_18040 [Herpetosiphonaceae bacterium]|nr:hypothetical protein [Herpetosiphonaceae bacterium]